MTPVATTETRRYAATTSKKWDGSASRFTDEQYQRSCLIDRGGDASVKERCSLPVLEPDGTVNTNALSAAAGRLDSLTDVTDAQKTAAKKKLRSLYNAAGMEIPDSLSMSEEMPRHELLLALGELETVDIPGIEILSVGGPYFGTGSPPEGDTFDETHLQSLADANNALAAQVKPPIKIGHGKAQRLLRNSGLAASTPDDDEQPAAGWLENFRVQSGKLVADAKAVPRKIADLMEVKAFRSRSVEMSRVTEQTPSGAGRTFDSVVTALALLGAKAPAVRTLDDVLAWYGEAGTATMLLLADEDADPDEVDREYAVGDVVWDPERGANDIMADLCAALNGPPGSLPDCSPGRFWVRDVAMSGDRALVCDGYGDDANAWVVPFTIGDDGEPVPSPSSDWTLASQKWLQAATTASGAALGDRSDPDVAIPATGADTSPMSDENTATLSDDQVVAFASTLGIDETDPAKRRDAVLAKFKEYAGETPTPPTPPDPDDPAPPAPTPPANGETDPRIAALEQRAALGERAYEERRLEKRDASINVAIRQGRIDPADKAKWERFFDQDEEIAMTALLSIPMQPRGRAFGSDNPGRVEEAQQLSQGYDAAYGSFAGALGITPYTLPANGGQS